MKLLVSHHSFPQITLVFSTGCGNCTTPEGMRTYHPLPSCALVGTVITGVIPLTHLWLNQSTLIPLTLRVTGLDPSTGTVLLGLAHTITPITSAPTREMKWCMRLRSSSNQQELLLFPLRQESLHLAGDSLHPTGWFNSLCLLHIIYDYYHFSIHCWYHHWLCHWLLHSIYSGWIELTHSTLPGGLTLCTISLM